MRTVKICTLTAVTIMALGLSGMTRKAQAHEISVTGIELNVPAELTQRKCVKKPKTVPGTGGPMLPYGYRWC